jgi:hypothetical protein
MEPTIAVQIRLHFFWIEPMHRMWSIRAALARRIDVPRLGCVPAPTTNRTAVLLTIGVLSMLSRFAKLSLLCVVWLSTRAAFAQPVAVRFTVANDWQSGYVAQIDLTNTGTAPVSAGRSSSIWAASWSDSGTASRPSAARTTRCATSAGMRRSSRARRSGSASS